jgi:alkane 1-monooxygenase
MWTLRRSRHRREARPRVHRRDGRGISINTAHELGHKRSAHERWLSKLALAQTCYGHFFVEHNRGHHVRVATPEDPASARLGESFWAFLPRTVWGSLRSRSSSSARGSRAPVGDSGRAHNELLNAWAMSVVLFGGLVAVFGVGVAPWLACRRWSASRCSRW